jgi:hypothetical protein
LEIDSIEPNRAVLKAIALGDDVFEEVDPLFKFTIEGPLGDDVGSDERKLKGRCIPTHELKDAVIKPSDMFIVIGNTDEDIDIDGGKLLWQFMNRYFTIIAEFDPELISKRGARIVTGTIKEVKWNKWLEFGQKDRPFPGLEVVGMNILSKNEVLLLLRNSGEKEIVADIAHLNYVDPKESGRNACVLPSGHHPLRDCLLYSFIVMDPVAFENADILGIAASEYADSERPRVKSSPKSHK